MKKLILLALVALVAGAAFAETAPAFSGQFSLNTTMNFDNDSYIVGATNDAVVTLNGVVSEWATVTAELAADQPALNDGGTVQNLNISLNTFALITDITGALGVDGPVGVSLKWGYLSFEAAEYNGVAGYSDVEPTSETNSYFGFVATFTIMEKVKLIAMVPPSTYTDWAVYYGGDSATAEAPTNPVLGFEAQFLGLIEGLDFNFWYTQDYNFAAAADDIDELGLTFGYDMAPLAIGGGFKSNMKDDMFGLMVSVAYDISDMFTAGVAFGGSDISEFSDTYSVGINGTFHAVADLLDVYAAVSVPFANFDTSFGVDAGIQLFLAGVTYTLGYDYQGAGFQSFEGPGLYFGVDASF